MVENLRVSSTNHGFSGYGKYGTVNEISRTDIGAPIKAIYFNKKYQILNERPCSAHAGRQKTTGPWEMGASSLSNDIILTIKLIST